MIADAPKAPKEVEHPSLGKSTIQSMNIDALLAAFGLPPGARLVATIQNDALGSVRAPKHIVELPNGERMFVGAVGQTWPSTARVELVLNAIACAAAAFPHSALCSSGGRVQIVAPLRNKRGSFLVSACGELVLPSLSVSPDTSAPPASAADTATRHYLSPFVAGRSLAECDRIDGALLAHALGAYHRMIAAASPPPADSGTDIIRDTRAHACWVCKQVSALRTDTTVEPCVRAMAERAQLWDASDEMDALCAVAPAWIHGDFQFKNVMLVNEAAHAAVNNVATLELAVIDLTDGCWAARVFDLAFALSGGGDDAPACVFDADMASPVIALYEFARRLGAYRLAGGAPLTYVC